MIATSDDVLGTQDVTFHHGRRSSFNAWFFTAFAPYINRISCEHKRSAFAGIACGDIVELGAGTGANLDHIPAGSRVLAVEPSRAMHERLAARAAARGLDVTVIGACGERLPIPDESVDEVICSLVLCTVQDPEATLSEVRRVLRPGGRFRFVEHVAAPPSSARHWLQRAVRRSWAWLFEGCDVCRDTGAAIQRAGFAHVEIRQVKLRRSLFVPVNTAIWGRAVR